MKKLIHIFFLIHSLSSYATHNRAGEITFRHISGLTYEITVVTYTRENTPADRPKLEINWGDNTPVDSLTRLSEVVLTDDINKNLYIGQHTYPGASPLPYVISVEDANRNENVLNIPNSVNTVFYIETLLYINPFLGNNNSPTLLNAPIDNACQGSAYIHNPGAFDVEGDSLYFSLQPSKATGGVDIPGYQFPSASNSISIDGNTGELVWDSPILIGEYNVAILVEEFRNGIKIGSVLRDMQITVVPCSHQPPVIIGLTDTCVVAGDTLDLSYLAKDQDGDEVTFTASGGPLANGRAEFITDGISDSVNARFYWESQCSDVQLSPYTISLKAVDDGNPNLVDFYTATVTVIGPAPENFSLNVLANAIDLKWDRSTCDQVVGYKIYRRNGPSGWTPDYCEKGVPSYTGFEQIATTSSLLDTNFLDDNNGIGLIPGEDYCYRIVACFPDGSESKASEELCGEKEKDVPIITHVSVDSTHVDEGQMVVGWSKPVDHDTIAFPGPYRYLIYRGEGSSSNLVLIDSLSGINDTNYLDVSLNTADFEYFYRIDIYDLSVARVLMGKSSVASSVYLELTPSDNQITLSWNEQVPWTNTSYIIYRQNSTTLEYDSIATTPINSYTDTGLVNLRTYCYQVRSIGAYSSSGIVNPILNFSQENCEEPIDNVNPCPPILSLDSNCVAQQNLLTWSNPTSGCADDVLEYAVYKKDSLDGSYYFVAQLTSAADTSFLHDNLFSVAGCYVVTSFDSVGNESNYSDSICVDNCPNYELPNVYTPNNDGSNDFFRPFPYKYINGIRLKVYNRWGSLVFETDDPDVMWNGVNQDTNEPCSDGIYFYTCTVDELFLVGIQTRVIKGFVHLINNVQSTAP